MNLFDLGALVFVVVAFVVGLRSGALPQLGGLAGAVAGGGSAIALLPAAEGFLASLDPALRAIAVFAGLLVSVGIGEAVGSAVGRAIAVRLGRGFLGALDSAGGALVGVAQALLVVWLAGGLLALGSFGRLSSLAESSTTVRSLDRILPPPAEVAVELGRLLDESGLPEVFVGLEPLPGEPVDLPGDPTVRAITQAAAASTVRVSAHACTNLSSGSGFVVAPGYVVTNAHVVAGGDTIRVNLGGTAYDSVTVLFDPDLDVALLHVPRLAAPALRLGASDPGRGAVGAALGYPQGGGLSAVPAAVTSVIDVARGRDIYGERLVTRRILELRADIQRGDSGGPLVLADGTVGGVIFAESRSNPEVGYALPATSVATTIAPSLGRTGPVPTGACIGD